MDYIGIDIGSTCAKLVVMNEENEITFQSVQPTGWSSIDTAETIKEKLEGMGVRLEEAKCVATGYGRVAVPYAGKTVTEITCHAKGVRWLYGKKDMAVLDIGGQDTKIILLQDGIVKDFAMNDKCSAGTGRFLEVMANIMALRPDELCELARQGKDVKISSMCTVFAESEVISLIGKGEKKENIAFAVVDSIAGKVVSQCKKMNISNEEVFLTGGLCECAYFKEVLEDKLGKSVATKPECRYAGAIGAALCSTAL